MIYFILLIIVSAQAAEDGLWEIGNKKLSKRIEAVYILAFFTLSYYIYDVYKIIFTFVLYIFIRVAIFDVIMHSIAGYELTRGGITSPMWGKFINYIGKNQVWIMRWFAFILSLIWYLTVIKT